MALSTARREPVAHVPIETTDTIALLRELVEQVKGLRADLRERRPAASLSRDDRAYLARLLPVLGGVYGSEGFTSRDCVEDDAPAVRLVLEGRSAKAIGKLLARAEGIAIAGLLVRRTGVDGQVTVWRVGAC
jgi:hypothetical protein